MDDSKKDRDKELQELRDIIKVIDEGVILTDKDLNINLWNTQAEKISGWNTNEVLGKKLTETIKFLRERDREVNFGAIKIALDTGEKVEEKENTFLVTRSGKEVPVSISVIPIKDHEKRVTGTAVFFRDLSQEKSAFRLRSDFAYMQHQLRTPLTHSLWSLERALEITQDNKVKELLESTDIELRSILSLSNKILDISEVDQGLITPHLTEVSVTEITNKLKESLGDLPEKHNIKVNFPVVKEDLKVKTDPKYLAEILFEIVSNAVIYSRENSEVNILLENSEDGILFQVKDNGIGIPNEDLSMIFTKFYRGTNHPQDVPGAGLGLYLSLRYAKLIGAKLWFTSKEDEGTTFYILIHSE